MKYVTLVGVGVMLASFAVVQGQQTTTKPSQSPSGTSGVEAADREFIVNAAADGHKEVELAEIAEKRGTSPEVKSLAQRIQKDHMQANQELTSLAKSKGVMLPSPPDHKAEAAKLEKEANFDRAYAALMVTEHKKAIALFEKASKSKDSQVSAFAQKTLPTLREHLKMSEQAAGSSSSKGSMSTPTGSSGTTTPKPASPGAGAPGSTTPRPSTPNDRPSGKP